jgi:hypothetical protein
LWGGGGGLARNDGLDEEFEMQVGGDPVADEQLLQQMDDYLSRSDEDGPLSVTYALQNFPTMSPDDLSRTPLPRRVSKTPRRTSLSPPRPFPTSSTLTMQLLLPLSLYSASLVVITLCLLYPLLLLLHAMQSVAHVHPDKADRYSLKAIKEALGMAENSEAASDKGRATAYEKFRLYLERCSTTGRLSAKVEVLHPQSLTVEEEGVRDDVAVRSFSVRPFSTISHFLSLILQP